MRAIMDKIETREWVVMKNDGQQIFGILHRPTKCKPAPVVIILHGFASSKHGSNRCYVALAEKFSKAGIASLRFDFRGSGDSEGTLSDITLNDLVSDSVTAMEYLESIDGIDAKKMGLFGASLGGSIAVLANALVQQAKAIALWAPVASGELWYRDFLKQNPEHVDSDPSEVLSSYRGVKLHPEFRDQFARMFAYKMTVHLKDLPILHMHGEKDATVSIAHQDAFRQTCAPINQQARFVTYPHGEHSLGFSLNFPEVLVESVNWFKKHL